MSFPAMETVSPRAVEAISSQVTAVELTDSMDVSVSSRACSSAPPSADQNQNESADLESGKEVTKAPSRRIDTDALTGLRGLAAVHVALGHYMGFSGVSFDLIGGASMSFFYLLSGFVMTIGYASKAINRGEVAVLDKKRFWRNRFARMFPTYMLTNVTTLVMVGIWWKHLAQPGDTFASFAEKTPLTAVALNMWLYPINFWKPWIPLPVNAVTWTVQTMAFFYVMFPWVLRVAQRVQRYYVWMTWLYILQAVTFMAIFVAGTYGDYGVGYWVARSWPPLRLLVFMMGCLAAVKRMRDAQTGAPADPKWWGRRATGLSLAYFALLAVGAIVQKIMIPEGMDKMPVHLAPTVALEKLFVRTVWEAFMPALFVALIVALSHCEDQGIMARLCRSAPMQWFGNVSMAFYMFHMEVIVFFCGALKTSFLSIPWWCFVVGLPISVVIAWLVTRFFEEPCRKLLRA